ncbi:MAG: HEAT repeat domain-containing protein [Deltaproteobacteria bacterium]|nr:HEAT repeat domain-containing protein [Deltaproteobacteria bacterium]
MKTAILVPMKRPERLIEKARNYLADMEAFLSNTPDAVAILLDALPHADTALILKMLPLLGFAGKDRVLWPLYNLMRGSKDESVCRSAAIQLGLAASLSNDPSALKAELIKNLSHPKASVRSSCALALGWEGNWPAAESLMAHISDPDRNVQSAVVAALTSVGDLRLFDLLTARLEIGTVEEQRCILLNLWRFGEKTPQVEDVYLGSLETLSPDLRVDVLSGLAMVPLSATILKRYRQLLVEENLRVRLQVLENLAAEDPFDYALLKDILYVLLADKDVQIRQAATRLLAKR